MLASGVSIAPGYVVHEYLQRGEDLDVYDVWSEERWCRCVAKTIRPDRRSEDRPRERLRVEGRLLLRLTHPHIARAYELIETPEPVLILETVTGATLARLITDARRLPFTDVVFLGLHLCSALRYLHGQGMLHLDLKPSNIIAERGVAKLLDLSIARPPGPGRPGEGTPQYMAPEQIRGEALSAATDAWGLGAVLFEAITGQSPFADSTPERYEQLEGIVPPLRRRRRLPAALDTSVVDRCLDPRPERRPGIAAVAAALEAATAAAGP